MQEVTVGRSLIGYLETLSVARTGQTGVVFDSGRRMCHSTGIPLCTPSPSLPIIQLPLCFLVSSPSVTLPLPLYVHVAHGARIRVSCISSALIRRGYCPAPPPVRDAVWDRLPICPRRGKVRCEPPLCSGSGENTGGLLCVCVCVCAR